MESLIKTYPQFKAMYEDIYDICLNTEKVMGMFSKELKRLKERMKQMEKGNSGKINIH